MLFLVRADAERLFAAVPEGAYYGPDAQWALGLMNAATHAPRTVASGCLTLAAGSHASAPPDLQPAIPADAPSEGAPARVAWARRTGAPPGEPPAGSALQLDIARLVAANRDVPLGALPRAVADLGLPVAYVGPTDGAGALASPGRFAALDARGVIPIHVAPPLPLGGVSLLATESRPEVQDYAGALGSLLQGRLAARGLVVVDGIRVSSPAAEVAVWEQAQSLVAELDFSRDRLFVIAPEPGPVRYGNWDRLSPILAWGRPYAGGRLLTSPSTQTRGLVTNLDVAPTVMEAFTGTPPKGWAGRPIRRDFVANAQRLSRYAHSVRVVHATYWPAMLVWGIFSLVGAAVIVAAMAFRLGERWLLASRLLVGIIAAFPLAMIVVSAAQVASSPPVLIAWIAALAVLLGLGAFYAEGGRHTVLIVFGLTGVGLAACLILGSSVLPLTVLSDFPVEGFRYYGMGNEYLGIYITALVPFVPLVGDALGRTRLSARVLVLSAGFWSLAALLAGAPPFGADFGGGVSVAIGAVATALWCIRGRLRAVDLLTLFGIGLSVAVALFAFDLLRPVEQQTHLGLAARQALEGGWPAARTILNRKLAMAARLATELPFVLSLVGVAPVLLLWYDRVGRQTREMLARRPLLRAGVGGTLVSAIAALLLNDSGVVPWAIASAGALAILFDALLTQALADPTTLAAEPEPAPVEQGWNPA